jgi:predicted GNAT family acetyltransferase
VAEDDGKITGFVQLIETAAAAIIDLIAVDSSQRGKGTATSLISGLMLKHGNKARIIVGTQAANIPSMRLYQKCGFRLTGSKYIFHYHNKSKI